MCSHTNLSKCQLLLAVRARSTSPHWLALLPCLLCSAGGADRGGGVTGREGSSVTLPVEITAGVAERTVEVLVTVLS